MGDLVERRVRELPVEEWRAEERVDGMRPLFAEMLEEVPEGSLCLDVCTGAGRVALHLAPRMERVIGVDVAEERLRRAREETRRRGLGNLLFLRGDVESTEYSAFLRGGDAVTSRLCMSRDILERAGRYLPRGGVFVFAAHHEDYWRETGEGSRYSFHQDELRGFLEDAGLQPERLVLDKAVVGYPSLNDVERDLGGTADRWRRDSRWDGLRRSFEAGVTSLTRAVLLGVARRE